MFKSILPLLMLFMAGCANDQSKSETNATERHATVTAQPAILQLNNGQKWKLDAATRQHMKEIKTHISQASHASGVLSGEELQRHADKLIKDCRMTGPDHDALHLWLGPFLQHVQALKDNRDAESASHALNDDVKAFDTYFE
ncbi:MAG: hypothetical protein EOO14_15510 [Chitinophagaceae bacterium]|nr:MAG: hypothetical protein EOO14_15510 [Chitinophagaceae bacterium]